jgi:uncharacterized protein YhaN
MNILQLELLAFGAFTNKILYFSAKQPGFHLIFGPNEAGKSTLRRAFINLFFCIPERTYDAQITPDMLGFLSSAQPTNA